MKIEWRKIRARSIRSIIEKHATLCSAKLESERRSLCREFDNKESIDELCQRDVDEQRIDEQKLNQSDRWKVWFISNWARVLFKFAADDVVIVTVDRHSLYAVVVVCYAFKRERKSKDDFRCSFLFDCVVIDWKKKKSKDNLCDLFLDRISLSFSLTSSLMISESLLASQLISSWSSSTLRNIIMMFEVFIKNEDCFITHFDENLLTELIHNVSSSSVLSFDSIFFVMFAFVSFSFVAIVLASSLSASRSRKRAHEVFSSALKKRSRLTNDHCDCTLSSKWLEDLKKARCIESVKRIEHFLRELYYLNRQICKKHINQLRELFELFSIENLVEIKEILWELLQFDERIEIFKSERSDFFEVFEDDD